MIRLVASIVPMYSPSCSGSVSIAPIMAVTTGRLTMLNIHRPLSQKSPEPWCSTPVEQAVVAAPEQQDDEEAETEARELPVVRSEELGGVEPVARRLGDRLEQRQDQQGHRDRDDGVGEEQHALDRTRIVCGVHGQPTVATALLDATRHHSRPATATWRATTVQNVAGAAVSTPVVAKVTSTIPW